MRCSGEYRIRRGNGRLLPPHCLGLTPRPSTAACDCSLVPESPPWPSLPLAWEGRGWFIPHEEPEAASVRCIKPTASRCAPWHPPRARPAPIRHERVGSLPSNSNHHVNRVYPRRLTCLAGGTVSVCSGAWVAPGAQTSVWFRLPANRHCVVHRAVLARQREGGVATRADAGCYVPMSDLRPGVSRQCSLHTPSDTQAGGSEGTVTARGGCRPPSASWQVVHVIPVSASFRSLPGPWQELQRPTR